VVVETPVGHGPEEPVALRLLSWMAEPMYDEESKAHVMTALNIAGVEAASTLNTFRRRRGVLSGRAVKLKNCASLRK
jgi:hypothetical protein